MSRLRTIRAVVAAVTFASVMGGGSVAALTPAGGAPLEEVGFVFHVFRAGPVKGLALIEAGSPGRVRYAFQGLPAAGALRVAASTRPCNKPHIGSAKVLGWSWGKSNGVVEAGQFKVEIEGAVAGSIRSLRVFQGAGTGSQLACSKATTWQRESATAAVTFENVMVSSFLPAPGPRGLVAVGVVDKDTVRIRAELLHKDRGTFSVVGSTRPCSRQHVASATVFEASYELGDTGTHEVGHFMDVSRTVSKPADAMRSIRITTKSEVAVETLECRGIIAILIGL